MAFTRAAVEHHTYNTNAEFANFRPYRRAMPTADLNVEAGSALPSAIAFSICACRGDIPVPAIVAVAITTVIRRGAENSVSQKWKGADFATRFSRRNGKMVRASVEQHLMCQFPAR